MIQHIVLLQFKQDLAEKEIQLVFDALQNLRQHIPEILSFSHGKYQSKEGLNKGFTHGFVMTFADERARDTYLDHPEHEKVAWQIINPRLEKGVDSVIAFDYLL